MLAPLLIYLALTTPPVRAADLDRFPPADVCKQISDAAYARANLYLAWQRDLWTWEKPDPWWCDPDGAPHQDGEDARAEKGPSRRWLWLLRRSQAWVRLARAAEMVMTARGRWTDEGAHLDYLRCLRDYLGADLYDAGRLPWPDQDEGGWGRIP